MHWECGHLLTVWGCKDRGTHRNAAFIQVQLYFCFHRTVFPVSDIFCRSAWYDLCFFHHFWRESRGSIWLLESVFALCVISVDVPDYLHVSPSAICQHVGGFSSEARQLCLFSSVEVAQLTVSWSFRPELELHACHLIDWWRHNPPCCATPKHFNVCLSFLINIACIF